ncbi:MAG: alpha-amylase family glycosyl hydrolase [Parvicellaceae bacterium]
MRRFQLLFLIIIFNFHFYGQDFLFHVEPLNWWVDMNSPKFEILVHGDKVGECDVNISDERIKLIKTINLENSNYIVLGIQILERSKAFSFDIEFSKEGKLFEKYNYQLLKKSKRILAKDTYNSSDVIYLITPDRFSNGDKKNDIVSSLREKKINRRKPSSRHGGDINGIINHLDYISDMGFTAIWSTPMLENNMKNLSYHGYAITDLYKIDPRMGTNELYKELSLKAKEKGIKLIKDVVLNHIGSSHWWMEDLPSEDWLNYPNNLKFTTHTRESLHDPYAIKEDVLNFTDGWFTESMPDLNQRNPILARYLIQNSLWWIEYAQLSGFRVDTYSYSDREFLNFWNNTIQNEYPGFNIVGEEWTTDKSIIGMWQKPINEKKLNSSIINQKFPSNVPSLMDFPLNEAILKSLQPKTQKWDHKLSILYRNMAQDYLYPNPKNMVVFLDNHDMSRVYYQLNHNLDYWKMAHSFLLTTRGIPQIYYGTEVLISDSSKPGDHGVLREDFPGGWDHDKKNAFTDLLTDKQIEAKAFLKNLLNWRKTCSAIHSGGLKHFAPSFENELYSILRYDKRSIVLLVMNNDSKKKKIIPNNYFKEVNSKLSNKLAVDIVNGKNLNINNSISINSKSFLLLELKY